MARASFNMAAASFSLAVVALCVGVERSGGFARGRRFQPATMLLCLAFFCGLCGGVMHSTDSMEAHLSSDTELHRDVSTDKPFDFPIFLSPEGDNP
mmetsp:Transcript_39511/g.99303  ORF Transcript_39511/g.99303 Transcript_39511/m.99303 type:complete len:96 (-) Transcript_39511:80-367(-)